MNYNELKEKVLIRNYQHFNDVVETTSSSELDTLIKEGWGNRNFDVNKKCTKDVNRLLASTENNETIEQLSVIYYRIFALVDSMIALDSRTTYILPIIEKGYAHFKAQDDKEGIVLLGTYLVDVIMYQRKDTDSVFKILAETLTAAESLEGSKEELYASIFPESNVFHYTKLFGDKLDVFIDEICKKDLAKYIGNSGIEQLKVCCMELYNQFNSAGANKSDFYLNAVEYFLQYLAQDKKAWASYELAVYYYNRYSSTGEERYFNNAMQLFNELISSEYSTLAQDAIEELREKAATHTTSCPLLT